MRTPRAPSTIRDVAIRAVRNLLFYPVFYPARAPLVPFHVPEPPSFSLSTTCISRSKSRTLNTHKSRPMPERSIEVLALSGRDMTTARSVTRHSTAHRVDTARRRRKSCSTNVAGVDLLWTKARTETRLPHLETG